VQVEVLRSKLVAWLERHGLEVDATRPETVQEAWEGLRYGVDRHDDGRGEWGLNSPEGLLELTGHDLRAGIRVLTDEEIDDRLARLELMEKWALETLLGKAV